MTVREWSPDEWSPDPLRGDPYSDEAASLRALIGAFPITAPRDVTR